MQTNKSIRSVHGFVEDPCPTVVYVYWDRRTGRVEAFPPRIRIGVGTGIRWVPFDLETMQIQGRLDVRFDEKTSPFSHGKNAKFEGEQPRSGAAVLAGTFPYTIVLASQQVKHELEVELLTAPVAARHVDIKRVNKQIVVVPHKVKIWAGLDQVEWDMDDDFEVSFASSPFLKDKFDRSNNKSGESNAPGPYKYSVRHVASDQVLDPDVEVEDPQP